MMVQVTFLNTAKFFTATLSHTAYILSNVWQKLNFDFKKNTLGYIV